MPRIIGTDIPNNKRLIIALTYIYGVGPAVAAAVCSELGLDPSMRAMNLSEEDKARLNALLQSKYVVEGDLRRQVQGDIKRLQSINCYRGQRHRARLPVRGQRSRTNCRTHKGSRPSVSGKRK